MRISPRRSAAMPTSSCIAALIRALQARRRRTAGHDDCARWPRSPQRISAAERRAMTAERETVDRLIAHFLADRIGADVRGPHLRRHPRRPVREARRHRRRRLRPGAHHRRRLLPLSRGPHALIGDRTRRDLPARRSRHRAAGRGRPGRRRAAVRASVRKAAMTAPARAAPKPRRSNPPSASDARARRRDRGSERRARRR